LQKRKKSVPLQPLSRGRAAEDDRLAELRLREIVPMLHRVSYLAMCKGARKGKPHAFGKPSENFFFKKNFRKNLEVTKKRLTFANAFPLKRELEKR